MTASSESESSPFAKITLAHIRALLRVLDGVVLREEQYVRRRYAEDAISFEEVLAFLIDLDLVRRDSSTLHLGPTVNVDGDQLAQLLLSHIARFGGRRQTALKSYLQRYVVQDGTPTFCPDPHERGLHSDLRNFLIECAVVSYDPSSDRYAISPEFHSLYADSITPTTVRPERIELAQKANSDLGLVTESAIVQYEIDRLGAPWADRVKHTALTNAAAGFDIESASVLADAHSLPRFIEVKAVSPQNLEFFWTENEVRVAKRLRSWYYLYLVPTGPGGVPDLERLHVVCDPVANILDLSDHWRVEPHVLRCAAVNAG